MNAHSNGTALPTFVSTREDALHQLGTRLPDAATAQEAFKFGRLSGWNVRKTPLLAQVGNQQVPVPGTYALVRDNPVVDNQVDVLGTAGTGYKIIQHEDLEGLMDRIAEESGATFDTAGELDGGRRAYLTMKLPGHAKAGGVDKMDNYITVLNSHDGNIGTWLMVTPVRPRCQSTLNLAFQGGSHVFKVQHTTQAHKYLAQLAHDALEFTFSYLDKVQEEADRLIGTPLAQGKFEQLIQHSFGAPKGAAVHTLTRTQNKLDHMAELFADSYNQTGVQGTAWAGLTALTEWHDHFSPVRGGELSSTDARSIKAMMDPAFKNKALKLMTAVAA